MPKPKEVKMTRDGDLLFLAIGGKQVLRCEDGQWASADPGWSVNMVQLWGTDGQTWDAFEFSFKGKPLDTVFTLDKKGNPNPVKVRDGGTMGSA